MSTHVFRYGDPVVPGVHELSKATLMAEEKPYVYHLLPASQHIGGAVLKAAAGPDSTAEYTIDLGGEPAPVYSYLHLHPDTALAIQSLNVTVHHSPGVLVEARIRQYNASGVEDFSVPLDWQPLPEGQPYALDFATDVTAIVAGGATMLEYRTSPVGGGTFAAASEVTYTSTIVTVSLSELRDVLVTICDEKDNYRFGFNGQEKVNEVNGIGNHNTALFWEYDTRLGRRWNLDPKPQISIGDYAANRNSPLKYNDPDGDCPTCPIGLAVGAIKAGFEFVGQVATNVSKGKSFSKAIKEVDYGDVAISFAQGFADGTTLGATSLISKHVATGLKSSIDWKPATENSEEKFRMLGGGLFFGKQYDKQWERVAADFVSGEISNFIGDKAGKTFSKALGGGRSLGTPGGLDFYFGKEIFKNMFTIPTKIVTTQGKDIGFKEYDRWRNPNPRVYIGPLTPVKIEVTPN